MRTASPLVAVAFLTRLPVPVRSVFSLDDVARSQLWFAAVGLALGACLLGIDRLANYGLPDPSVDVLVIVALIVLTGALHLDGLADAADGLFGGASRERRLEIMHDVHAGTYAITAIISVLALKFAGLIAIPASVRVETLLLFPCLARFGAVFAVGVFPYARDAGMGLSFRTHAWPLGVAISGGTALAASILFLGAGGIAAFVIAGVCALAVGGLCMWLVGGMTGDVIGATVEIAEAVVILCIAFAANRGWIEAWVLA